VGIPQPRGKDRAGVDLFRPKGDVAHKPKSLARQGDEPFEVGRRVHDSTGDEATMQDEICLCGAGFTAREEEESVGASHDPVYPFVGVHNPIKELEILMDACCAFKAQGSGELGAFLH
jgi:hypothetical protein